MLFLKNTYLIKSFLFIIIFTFIFNSSFGQTHKDLENKKIKNQREIAYTNKLLKETRKNQESSFNQLKLIDKKIDIRKDLIQNIKDEIFFLNERINENNSIITSLESDLQQLKNEYAKMIYYAYKNKNSYSRWMYILSSKDFNQAYKRMKYLQQYAKFRQRQVEAITAVRDMIKKKLSDLESQKQEKKALINDEQEATITLSIEKKQQNSTLNKLKSKEKELKIKLAQKRKAARKLQKAIEDLIAKEAVATSGASKKYKLTPEEKLISDKFGINKGRLPWPTSRGIITVTFGEHNHPTLKGIKIQSNGVTIATTTGTPARAIFDGVVRQVITIPGKHKTIIIRHGEYLSVYSNLKEVYVSVGDNVSAKEEIGVIYTDKEGDNTTNVELQIWKGTVKLNPSYWLSKK